MSMFFCNPCQQLIDSDHVECHEDDEHGLICSDCYDNISTERFVNWMIKSEQQYQADRRRKFPTNG